MDQKLVKTNICFSHFSDKCFSHFPIPKSVFWRVMGRNGHEPTLFPLSFHTLFSHFPHPQIQISGDLGKKRNWTPSSSFRIHFFLFPNPNFETLWEKMVLDPNRTGCISICDSLCVWAFLFKTLSINIILQFAFDDI